MQKRVDEAERKSVHWRTRIRDRVEQAMRDKKYLGEAGGDANGQVSTMMGGEHSIASHPAFVCGYVTSFYLFLQDATLFRLQSLRQRINVPLVTPSIDVLRSLAEREVVDEAQHWRNAFKEEQEKNAALERQLSRLKALVANDGDPAPSGSGSEAGETARSSGE